MTAKYETHPLDENYNEYEENKRIESGNARRFADDLLRVVKRSYRKHACDEDSIGWEELQDEMMDVLCNVMGDDNFVTVFGSKPVDNYKGDV